MSSFKENFKATLKSSETEDWLDYRFFRPMSYLLACVFARLDIHPNTVTIASMFIGAGSAWFFMQGSIVYGGWYGFWLNVVGILLLILADVFDCTDGQLARMTGKKSRLGRILDGIAGFTWFIPIYLALVARFYFHHDIEFGWLGIENTPENSLIATLVVFAFALWSGVHGMGGQQRLADYYIQTHLFFLKGEKGSELDNSKKQQEIYDATPAEGNRLWRWFLGTYVTYTKKQERVTPEFQNLMRRLREKYGATENFPADIREEFHRGSKALMGWNGMLTFNFRTSYLILFCLLDVPVLNFIVEGLFMELFAKWINHRHESLCRRLAEKV